ncbi:hypothetical protein NECAME_10816, partial [Necator americanus]
AAFSGYIIGVTEGHFNAVLPFISTAGCFLPEASIFAQFLNMASFFMIIMFYMRHRQTVEYYGHRLEWEESGWRKMSLVLMGIGIMSAVGLTIVANFRVCEMGLVHAIGALMTFFAILVYCWGQVILSYALVPRMASMPVNHFRFVVVTLATCFLILHDRDGAGHDSHDGTISRAEVKKATRYAVLYAFSRFDYYCLVYSRHWC